MTSDLLARYWRRTTPHTPLAQAHSLATGERDQVVQLLDDLLAAHVEAICFEALDAFTRRAVPIDLDHVVAKLLDGRRGGYCHEHAALLRAVLGDLGLTTRPALARILLRDGQEPGPFSHQATLVDVHGTWFVADPGFGAGTPSVALALDGTATVRTTPHGQFRVIRASQVLEMPLLADNEWVVQSRASSEHEFRSIYGFALRPWQMADLEVSNWFTSTQPDTMFLRHLVLARSQRDGRKTTLSDSLVRRVHYDPHTTSREEQTLQDAQQLAQVLRTDFCLNIDDDLVTDAWRRVTSGPRP